MSEAAQGLAREFDLSLRQAYRYLQEAARLEQPVPIAEATVPITLKLPPSTVRLLRAYAKGSGLTIGTDRDARVRRLSARPKKAWLSDTQRVAHLKFISTMHLTDCENPSSHRRTTFWCRDASASLARE